MSTKILTFLEKSIDILNILEYNSVILRNSEMLFGGDILSNITRKVSEYVKNRGINISKMARDTGLPYTALYNSLSDTERKRDLRDYEFMSICFFLGVDPREFADKEKGERKCTK